MTWILEAPCGKKTGAEDKEENLRPGSVRARRQPNPDIDRSITVNCVDENRDRIRQRERNQHETATRGPLSDEDKADRRRRAGAKQRGRERRGFLIGRRDHQLDDRAY